MKKRLTQRFPFLLPFRRWQRKCCFYIKMFFDGNTYAKNRAAPLPHPIFNARQVMLNTESGFDMTYQRNKVDNLKIAAATLDGLVIGPGEVFSFWQAVRKAEESAYKDALCLMDGEIVPVRGGGLCQLSTLICWVMLHGPFGIVERHGHTVEHFPPPDKTIPMGVDATIQEGWLDLKLKNLWNTAYQLSITFDETHITVALLGELPEPPQRVEERNVCLYREADKLYRRSDIFRGEGRELLFTSCCELGYEPEKEELCAYV